MKTLKELFEEFGKWSCEDCTTSLGGRIDSLYNEKKKKMLEIPLEAEELIRKEVLEENIELIKRIQADPFENADEFLDGAMYMKAIILKAVYQLKQK